MTTGDLIRYRRLDVGESFKADHRRGVWVDDFGLILYSRQQHPPRPDKDYLVSVFFPAQNKVRVLRASKISEVF